MIDFPTLDDVDPEKLLATEKASGARYRALTENGSDMIVETDPAGRIVYISPNAHQTTGFSSEELVGQTTAALMGEGTALQLEAAWRNGLKNPEAPPWCVEYEVEHKDGRTLWLESRPVPVRDAKSGEFTGVIDIVRDITIRKAADHDREVAEKNLEFANVLLSTQMDASPDGIMIVDTERNIIGCNRAFAEMCNLSISDVMGRHHNDLLATLSPLFSGPGVVSERLNAIYEDRGLDTRDVLRLPDGRTIDVCTVTIYTPSGVYLGRSWFYHDVTERERILAEVTRLARQDVLTGLANRGYFVESLRMAIEKIGRGGTPLAVFYLDLDHFKDVNDTLGHPVGDDLLKSAAARLLNNTRSTDLVARFGGDEFAVMVSDVRRSEDVANLASTLIEILGEPYLIRGHQVYSAASIGVELYGPDASDAETLLSHADLALYSAKGTGRGGYVFFEPEMDRQARSRVKMAADLRAAIRSGQLFLVYQPQIDISTLNIVGVEALVRWRHPEYGILTPDAFVPVAEQTGTINQLGRWVLTKAIDQVADWRERGISVGRMAVNVSALQFRGELTLEKDIKRILRINGVSAKTLEIELTESVLMSTSMDRQSVIDRLRQSGISIAIDDFGTGFSSFDYLRRFPVDRIKIAQAFIQESDIMSSAGAIVRATMGLARELGIEVIAEGVETVEQLEMLKAWQCKEAQGFYFSQPLSADDIAPLLARGSISPPVDDRLRKPEGIVHY